MHLRSRKCIFAAEYAYLSGQSEECRRRQVIDLRILLAAAEEERDAYLTKLREVCGPAYERALHS